MADGKKHQWIVYGAAAASLGYAMYKYLRYDRRTPVQLKEEGNSLYTNGNHEKALECYLEGLKAAEKNEDAELQGVLHNNISQTYFVQQEFPMALLHVEKTLKLRPTHLNSFKRLAKLEKIGHGHGGIRGAANIGAYIFLQAQETQDRTPKQPQEKENAGGSSTDKPVGKQKDIEWHKVLEEKIEAIAKKRSEQIKRTDSLIVSLVKLEEVLRIFKHSLSDATFGPATEQDEETLRLIDQQEYAALLKHLEGLRAGTQEKSRRTLFIIGNIRYLQDRFEAAIKYLTESNNPYGAVLAVYITGKQHMKMEGRNPQEKKEQGQIVSPEQERLIKEKSNDPLIKMYLAQTYLFLNNIPEYLKCMVELENEGQTPLPFISNAISQIMYNEHEEALKTIKKALIRFPDDINTLCAAVELLVQLEEHRDQLEEVLETLENQKYKKSPRTWFFRYVGNSVLDRPEKAREALDRALDLDEYNASLLIEKAHAMLASGNPIGFSMLEKAAMMQPEISEATYRKMVTYECLYEIQETYPEVSKASARNPEAFAGVLAGNI